MEIACKEMACAFGAERARDENTVKDRNECTVTWCVPKLEVSSEEEAFSRGFSDAVCGTDDDTSGKDCKSTSWSACQKQNDEKTDQKPLSTFIAQQSIHLSHTKDPSSSHSHQINKLFPEKQGQRGDSNYFFLFFFFYYYYYYNYYTSSSFIKEPGTPDTHFYSYSDKKWTDSGFNSIAD
ncbi:hypothetical protein QTP70_017287 [Hemibagrus guttatus]|uniref:Uncharacterized protein n=1 Tax=Hemibagrus guttatus TaxID=175788 RepID=A0AAE0REK2_9TELE|nr:hypothetical protein QTP70_017287 [Hemibagrus guttatus]